MDSNVWGFHFFPDGHSYAPLCRAFLKTVAEGQVTAVVSTFVLEELLGIAVRARSQAGSRALSIAETQSLAVELRGRVEDFGTEIHDADTLAGGDQDGPGVFARADDVLRESEAIINPGAKGKITWKSPSGADGVHVALAERIDEVSFLATCDGGLAKAASPLEVAYVPEDYK